MLSKLAYRPKSRDELFKYWQHPDKDNLPTDYLNAEPRSLFLLKVMRKHANADMKILEIGCNVGRNLNYLLESGYTDLSGIEICEDAVRLLKKNYPELKDARIYNSPVEDVIREFSDSEFDIIFTMATLEHIHKDSEWVFGEMARVSKLIITIEDEHGISKRHFPRDYKKVFEGLGMKQVEEIDCSDVEGLGSCHCRVFKK